MKFLNGNCEIEILNDGTRIINFDGEMRLEYPLNIDIRVSNRCSFGLNPITGKAFCSFCHESARTDGSECDYFKLIDALTPLPGGIELAIGGNQLSPKLMDFLKWASEHGFVCNLTINQGHLRRDINNLKYCVEHDWIKGIGVSYRSELKWDVPKFILEYPNTIFHVIAGIDDITEIISLESKGVKKILVLGEKDFGFNAGKVNSESISHKRWKWWCRALFETFDVLSFDNLALEQLKVQRFFPEDQWNEFHQGEYSFYINAVDEYFSPSSRNSEKTPFTDIKEYFQRK